MSRRSNDLTSIIGSIDKRLKVVETTNVTSVPSGTYVATPAADEDFVSAPGSVSSNAPWTYRKIDSAYIYGNKATQGNNTRVELFLDLDDNNDNTLDFDLQLGSEPFIQISGLNGNSTTSYNVSGTFKLLDYDVLSQSPTRQTWRVTPPAGSTHSLFYSPVIYDNNNAAQELIAKRAIDSASVTGSEITIVFNSAHVFKVDDVIYTDLASPFFGIDGLFKITQVVDSNTIKVQLDTPVTAPQTYTWTSPNPRKYVYAVVHRYVEEGTVWVDETYTPNKVFVWKGIRWYDTADPIGDVTAEPDGIPPKAPTNLVLTAALSDATTDKGAKVPYITATWVGPTQKIDNNPIVGSVTYELWYKQTAEAVWEKKEVGLESSYTIRDQRFVQGLEYQVRVYAVDFMKQYSEPVLETVVTGVTATVLNPPSTPTITSKLGTLRVTWDGFDSTGAFPLKDVIYIEFHYSTTNNFTPSASTLYTTTPITVSGNYIVVENLNYSTTYYFKTVFVRTTGTSLVKSDPSVQASGQVTPLVNTDIIGQVISGANIVAGSINAADKIIGNTITGSLIQALAIDAGKIAANTITANQMSTGVLRAQIVRGDVISTSSVDSGARVEMKNTGIFAYNSSNTLTFSVSSANGNVFVGGYIQVGGAAGDVNSGSTTVSGTKITTNTIEADRMLVTDTLRYRNTTSAYEVAFGSNAIASYGNASAGLNFKNNGTDAGYFGVWGSSGYLELGKDFFSSYISLGLNGQNNLSLNFTNGYDFNGTTLRSYAALAVYRDSAAAMFVGASSSASDRAILADTTSRNILIGNGGGLWGTTNQSFDVYGRIRATGTITASTTLSSSRYKTDIRDFNVPESLFNISPKLFKYDNKIRYESWKEFPKDEPDISDDQLGAIAEDFIDAGLGYLVSYDEQGRPEALDYSKIAVLLIPEIKTLRTRLSELENRLGE